MGNKGCADDLVVMYKYAHRYTPSIGGYPDDMFPFYDLTNVQLLCPQQLRDWFDADMEGRHIQPQSNRGGSSPRPLLSFGKHFCYMYVHS